LFGTTATKGEGSSDSEQSEGREPMLTGMCFTHVNHIVQKRAIRKWQ